MSEPKAAIFSTENRVETAVYPHDVFMLTESGTAQLQRGGTSLPAEALEILVMLDGKRTIGDVEQKLPHLQPKALRDLVRSLLSAQLVRAATMVEAGDIGVDFDAFFAAASADMTSPGTQASAVREAQSGAPKLEKEGYYVSIARQALKARAPAAGARHRVLHVEDDPDMSTLVKRLLDKAGFEVTVSASRDSVVAKLRTPPLPELIVLDVTLPDLNGFELLQRLKAHPALKAIPIVMLTAEAAPESIVRGLASGADGYITKPFDHERFVRGVKAVLGL
ncbi:MAG: response regulator transcription factor [Clostridia bacterium]